MYLILCSVMDVSAQWAASGLSALLPDPLELVHVESLVEGAQWEHRVSSDGTHVKITLADGRVLCSSKLKGVVNRLSGLPATRGQWPSKTEMHYAHAEIHALYLSWLQGLPCVMMNRPSPTCLGGQFFRVSEWLCRAAKAGLTISPYVQTDDDGVDGYSPAVPEGATRQSVIVAGDRVFPAWMPKRVKAGCVQLAKDVGMAMTGAELYLNASGEWCFAGADAAPDLRPGGNPLLEKMAAMLQNGDAR